MSVIAVILDAAVGAGAFARRLFAGRSLVEHALDVVAAARPVDRIIVVGDTHPRFVAAVPGVSVIGSPAADSGDPRAATLALALTQVEEGDVFASDVAVLIDPACPLLTPGQIDGAVEHLRRCGADTLVSVHATDGRLWQQDEGGLAAPMEPTPDRPCYVENGALVAVRVGVFQQTETLPAGRTVLYSIPMATALRPTGEADWAAAEMMSRATTEAQARARLKGVGLVCFDFDGVMTDNRVLVMEDGTEGVLCNRSDGLGLERLRAAGIPVAVISKERNPVVTARCRKLKIPCHQGIDDKLRVLRELAAEQGVELTNVAYMGNDINDLPCMIGVGIAVAPADAYGEVLAIAHVVTRRDGGFGAVRELCDLVLASRGAAA
ncbi:MAG: HAD hydrolase family protein [Rhodospirillales bacterium]